MNQKLLLFLFIIVLSACGVNNNQQGKDNNVLPKMVEVQIKTIPADELKPNEEITIQAHVTQGAENVDDAHEVKFEVWKKGQEEHEMIEAKHQGEGVYSIKKTFQNDGVYHVISHVTARDMHNMPKKEIVVGDVSQETQVTNKPEEHHHPDRDLDILMQTKTPFKVNEDTTLAVRLQKENEPFIEAEVQFEIWMANEKERLFVKAEEDEDGRYNASTTFSKPGSFFVNVHITKGELHEHKTFNITVN